MLKMFCCAHPVPTFAIVNMLSVSFQQRMFFFSFFYHKVNLAILLLSCLMMNDLASVSVTVSPFLLVPKRQGEGGQRDVHKLKREITVLNLSLSSSQMSGSVCCSSLNPPCDALLTHAENVYSCNQGPCNLFVKCFAFMFQRCYTICKQQGMKSQFD